MSQDAQSQIFLERHSYRQRRLLDALRLLPVLGVMLWMLPVFWPRTDSVDAPVAMSNVVTYVFVIWGALIAASYLLSRALKPQLIKDLNPEPRGDEPPSAT